jgi:hypothetical protein
MSTLNQEDQYQTEPAEQALADILPENRNNIDLNQLINLQNLGGNVVPM